MQVIGDIHKQRQHRSENQRIRGSSPWRRTMTLGRAAPCGAVWLEHPSGTRALAAGPGGGQEATEEWHRSKGMLAVWRISGLTRAAIEPSRASPVLVRTDSPGSTRLPNWSILSPWP